MRLESGSFTLHKYLINQSKKGDRKAQHELYNLYVEAMYSICRRMMGNDDDAKDVLQDSFIQAFSKLHTLQKEVLFPAWLKRIVVNSCINALKKNRNMIEPMSDEIEVMQDDEDTQEYSKYQVFRVKQALDRISEGCRTVLNLYIFEGYDNKEIAQILSISESASKAQYSKAKSKISQILKAGPL